MSTNAAAFFIPTSDIQAKPEFFTEITHTLYGNTKISRHDATGNYFITGIVKNYNEDKKAEYEALRSKLPNLRAELEKAKASGDDDDIAIAEAQLKDIESLKEPKEVYIANWLQNKETKKFLTDFKNSEGCFDEQVAFKITKGPNEFRGTYTHRYVMHHLLHWMDSMYAIKVAKLLDRYLVEETERYKEQAEEAKANELKAKKRYKKLSNQMKEFSEEVKLRDEEQTKLINEQSEKLDTLLDYANNITISLCHMSDKTEDLTITADCSQEKLDETLEYLKKNNKLLEEKSYKSTIDPKDKKLITHFALLKPRCPSDTKTLIIRGQQKRIDKRINELEDTHNVLIPITYNANSITLMNNAKDLYNKMRGAYVKEHNKKVKRRNNKLLKMIEEYNNQIIRHNRKYPDNKKDLRNYTEEKEPVLLTETINNFIKFNTTSIVYHDNPYIPYDDVIGCIIRMNEETQRNPSDEYDEEDTVETIKCVKECIDAASTAIKNLPIDTAKARKGIK